MKTGWLGIVAGACFAGVFAFSLLVEGAFTATDADIVASEENSQSEGQSPSGSRNTERPLPEDKSYGGEFLALPREVDSAVVRVSRTSGIPLPRGMAARDAVLLAAGGQRPGCPVGVLERVVAEARCEVTKMLVLAHPVRSHAPPDEM